MEVTVRHAGSGRSCVVGVADTDTVLDLKTRAVGEIFAGRRIDAGRVAGGLAAHIGTGTAEGEVLDDTLHIADTRLEGGDHVQLVRRYAEVKAPAEYPTESRLGNRIALSPCGRFLCLGTPAGTLAVYDTTTTALIVEKCLLHACPITCLCFSRCGLWLGAAYCDDHIRVFDAETWERRTSFLGHTSTLPLPAAARNHSNPSKVFDVCWTHCGKLLTASRDKTARLWDVEEEGVCTAVFQEHTGTVQRVVVSRARIFTGSADKTIRVWDLDTLSHTLTLTGHRGAVNGLDLTTDEKQLVSCSVDGTVKVWCTDSLAALRSFEVCGPLSVTVSQGCGLIAVVSQEGLMLHHLDTCRLISSVDGMHDCHAVRMSPCGRWMFSIHDGCFLVCAVEQLRQGRTGV